MGKYEKNKTEYIPVRVEPELKARLQAAADQQGISMSEMVRRLISNVPLTGIIVDGKVVWNKEE